MDTPKLYTTSSHVSFRAVATIPIVLPGLINGGIIILRLNTIFAPSK
jgi:glycosyltransferase A (GT-A) superfamily protein (DUF2064 family)